MKNINEKKRQRWNSKIKNVTYLLLTKKDEMKMHLQIQAGQSDDKNIFPSCLAPEFSSLHHLWNRHWSYSIYCTFLQVGKCERQVDEEAWLTRWL